MITLKSGKIKWEDGDVRTMAKIIGSEDAVRRWAPPLSSIVKLAAKKGLLLSKKAKRELETVEAYRRECAKLQSLKDATIPDERAEKYFPHQRVDLNFIYKTQRPAYLLASEPGVGKTLVSIRFAEFHEDERIAVITPNTAKEQWRDEIRRWRDRKRSIGIVEGTVKEQIRMLERWKRGWIIGHWESLVHAGEGWLAQPWDLVILDEAHKIQNRQAQRTNVVHAMKAEHRLALSGHPFSNAVNELFPILQFLYPDLYTSFWRWAHLHIEIDPGAWGGLDLKSPRRPKLLKWELRPITLRHTKKELGLPEITRVKRTVYLTKHGMREYEKLKKQFFVELDAHEGEKNILAIPSVLARITRMRQYLIDPEILGAREKSVKYAAVLELLAEVGKPSVIFTMYRQAALRLHSYLTKRRVRAAVIVGGMQKKVNPIKRKFLKGQLDAVIILISVGGESLNFGKYGYVIGLDFPWNPKALEQPEGRVDRPEEGTGKIVPTTAYWICVKDSYEERMMQNIVDKREDFSKVFTVSGAKKFFR